jgi:hypothetical protein
MTLSTHSDLFGGIAYSTYFQAIRAQFVLASENLDEKDIARFSKRAPFVELRSYSRDFGSVLIIPSIRSTFPAVRIPKFWYERTCQLS